MGKVEDRWSSSIDPEVTNKIGNELLSYGNVDDAIALFKAALALSPRHIGILYNLGVALRFAGRFKEAKSCFRRCLALDPSDWDAKSEIDACDQKDTSGSDRVESAKAAFRDGRNVPTFARLPDWPGALVLDGNAASDDLSCRPVKISYSPRTDADKSLYDITATVTLRDDKMQRFWLFRTVPEVLDLARKSDRERCRELGKRLDAIGGFTLMLTVGEFVQMSSNEARMFVERIAWKDVGMWRG